MNDQLMLALGIMGVFLCLCAVLVAWRLRRWSTERAESERRAAEAFEEMNRLARELRERKS